ncbi:MAG: hypothetical protein NC393_01465 [Clostridium sp.]|nr:hypothetical protein [Clostridium sp.]MCM1170772.1 hypothetical protein [Clostridium sp.]MCM1209752.1 hypothetical protein [Ruminococcus sp.]
MSVLRDVIHKADSQPEMTKEIKETLNLLYELSEQKAKNFESNIDSSLRSAGTTENQTVPTKFKLASHQEIRVTTAKTPDTDIVTGIGNSLKDILAGTKDSIIGGLADLINTSLKAVLGAGEGEERMQQTYYIATEGMSIVRLDLICWSRHITASGITKYAEKSLVCAAVKSSVDLEKLDFNSFLSTYNAQLVRCKFKDNELMEEIKNARYIYDTLCGKNTLKAGIASANASILPDQNAKFDNIISNVCNSVKTQWPN